VRKVKVGLNDRSYEILVGEGLLCDLGKRCAKLGLGRRCVVISDSNVGPLYGDQVLRTLAQAGFDASMIGFPAGETAKKMANVEKCYNELARLRLERKSFVVALGGGVVGDLAGFVAATYLRGLPFVQVPTTLLAQVDSSVGGKVGVNLKAGKNLVGAFHQPRLVLCDLDTLKSLPDREFRSGFAEVIKYGIIYDASLFRRLERDLNRLLKRNTHSLASAIARCCAIKADVVSQDETETGLRAILNFGHTIGHALEAISKYGEYLHGEAISIGQVLAAQLSAELTTLPAGDVQRIRTLFRNAGLPVDLRIAGRQKEALLGAMRLDKKVADGQLKFVLARKIGQVEYGHAVPESLLRKVLGLS
jgi:3-dehydroquinate synthase